MSKLKKSVGEKIGPFEFRVSPAWVPVFGAAVKSQCYLAAAGQGIGGASPTSGTMDALPTFLTVLRQGEFDLLQKFGIPLSTILHGEQEYEYLEPISPGDLLKYTTAIQQVHEKRGSSKSSVGGDLLQFLVLETEVHGSGGRKVALTRSTLIIRTPNPAPIEGRTP